MAVGDKVYIADKETLDVVNAKTGSTTDGGGSATAGTLFGKINALISSLAAHVANWTAARAANLDTQVSSRESEASAATRFNTLNSNTGVNNTPSATGTLSQKLSHLINLFTSNGQKHLVSKVVNFTASATGTHTILNVTGPGQFEFAFTDMGDTVAALTFEFDGNVITLRSSNGGLYVAQSIYSTGVLVFQTPTANYSADAIGASMRPLHFKSGLKISVTKTNTAERFFRCNYAVYE